MQVSTSAPEKLARIHPRAAPEMIESLPAVPVLLEPWIEWNRGCDDGGFSSSPHTGPHPRVYESEPSQEPVQRQLPLHSVPIGAAAPPLSSLSASATWSHVSGGGGGGRLRSSWSGAGAFALSMKCALTSSRLPSATVTSTVHVSSTVGPRLSGVHSCSSWLQVPAVAEPLTSTSESLSLQVDECDLLDLDAASRIGMPHRTCTLSTCAPEKLTRTQPRDGAERMESEPYSPVLFEPWIEWTAGCKDAGCSSTPHSGPQPSVYESDASHEPV